jgi:predicted amidohydrolase
MNPANSENIRVSALQWQMLPVPGLAELLLRVEIFVKNAANHHCDALLLPEFFCLSLIKNEINPHKAIDALARNSQKIIDACSQFAKKYHINIIAGSLPVLENGKLYNISTFCHRDGRPPDRQYKLHPTPYEKHEWDMQGGNQLTVFKTDMGKVGILICYDVEFPELARLLSDQGMQILFVPFWTDSQNAYHRVRYCAQARAIENECYVVLAGSFGSVRGNDVIDNQYALSAVFSPSDLAFPEHAILAEAQTNIEMPVIADLDLGKLDTLRNEGAVQISRDRRRDLYRISWLAGNRTSGE